MKLWEALEKSNKVRRSCWGDDVKDLDISVREVITTDDFRADDWEPVIKPVGMTCAQAEALEEIANLKALAQPLCDYLYDKGTPHDSIIITQEGVQHLHGYRAAPFEIRD